MVSTKVRYLGFELDWDPHVGGIIRPQQDKLEALQNLRVNNLKDLRSFLCTCNFFRRHIKNFTQRSAALTNLLRKDQPWKWGEIEELEFNRLKSALLRANQLGVPRSQGAMFVITDASKDGGGGGIFQLQSSPKSRRSR